MRIHNSMAVSATTFGLHKIKIWLQMLQLIGVEPTKQPRKFPPMGTLYPQKPLWPNQAANQLGGQTGA